MWIEDLDALRLSDDEGGCLEELGRTTLSEGPWSTVAYLVRTRPHDEAPWEGPLLWVHRYQRAREGWKLVSRFRCTETQQTLRLATWLTDLLRSENGMGQGEA